MRDHLPHWVDNRPGASGHYYATTYYAGVNATCDFRLATAHGAGGLPVCLADGSAVTVNPGISGQTWWFAMTPNGGEVLSNDW
jgi:hypothetical protein